MNGTPRLQSAFPQSPQANDGPMGRYSTPSRPQRSSTGGPKTPPAVLRNGRNSSSLRLPTQTLDAPSQRLYTLAFYVALNSWRVYEAWSASDDLDSTWLFLKWASIDGVFLFCLQTFRIPWLEWTFATTLAVFLVHVVGNMFLMFRIPIPVGYWISGMVKLAYDRELSISGRRVKPADIIYNSSLILGKQIVHILPEGSAVLNPDHVPLCLDAQKSQVDLPIRINQTNPTLVELFFLDLDNGGNETISISSKQLKQMKRQADKMNPTSSSSPHRDLLLPIRKPGIYRLQKVLDESNLDVQTRNSDALVVSCPRASIKNPRPHKCRGELSNLILEVEGTPPLKVKYSRQVNHVDRGFSFQNIQPDNLRSPLLNQKLPATLVSQPQSDISWAKSQRIEVPLNESLNVGGEWLYMVDEIHDGYGNVVNYSGPVDEMDRPPKPLSQWHLFSVHERPQISLTGCDDRNFLQAARGEVIELPTKFHAGQGYSEDGPFSLTYSFAGNSQRDHPSQSGLAAKIRQLSLKDQDQRPQVKDTGWYTLSSVSNQYCSGDILEPSSCFLYNPPEPGLSIRPEKIFDKCANHAIGLLVDLELTGTPPFRLRYTIEHSKNIQTKVLTIESVHSQLDLTPSEAGEYIYRFQDIADAVYGPRPLKDKVPVLEQDVKPSASVQFLEPKEVRKACFGEVVSVGVAFLGEAPWTLQYELIHNGKRTKHSLETDRELSTIVTENLVRGGQYTLMLTSVKDRSNCKRPIKESIRIDVRSKPPHVSFGEIDKKRSISALQGLKVDLPLRLAGERPWTVRYKNLDTDSPPVEQTFWQQNSVLTVSQEGRYELLDVMDSSCPGSIDKVGKVFEVSWVPRPSVVMVDGAEIGVPGTIERPGVCQGDDDTAELRLSGSPPYSIRYEQHKAPDRGAPSVRLQSLRTGFHVASMEMDTFEAGRYTYKFIEIGDSLYDGGQDRSPLVLTQRVHPLPAARFDSPGHIYGFCKEDASGEEFIPITLEGVPPFSLEIAIKHHSSANPEIVSIPNIHSKRHNLSIPRRHLDLGQHVVSIQKVRDARGCQRSLEYDPSSVRVSVSGVPTIIPLESKKDYCVGERISFSLSGHAPFEIFYTFNGVQRKATSRTADFRRIAERPGNFTITAVSDGASGRCKAHKEIAKTVHQMPSVKISRGEVSVVDIHEGGAAELHFEFWGTPPFEFTYIRSTNAQRGRKPEVLDIKHDISYEHKKSIKTSDEGTYEVVAIKDKFCSFSSQSPMGKPEGSAPGS